MTELLKDLWLFMRERKKFWLAPIVIVMLLLGLLIVLAQGSAVAPFIYTLFKSYHYHLDSLSCNTKMWVRGQEGYVSTLYSLLFKIHSSKETGWM